MRILHVSMGIPPFRVGGLNEYCLEVILQQMEDGHEVSILYPGSYTISKLPHIKKDNSNIYEIEAYKLQNPLPLSLVFGVNSPDRYMKRCSKEIFGTFLDNLKPDVIHIHSIQGIYKEFFECAYEKKYKMIFTTHDYYPICLRCSLYDNHHHLCNELNAEKCTYCNQGIGLSKKQEILMQSKIYSKLKYSWIVKKMRKAIRHKINNSNKKQKTEYMMTQLNKVDDYERIRKYYSEIMGYMSIVHCNSQIAQNIYSKIFPKLEYKKILITKKSISGLSKEVCYHENNTNINIGYIGGKSEFKGMAVLIAATLKLDEFGIHNWNLRLYGGNFEEEEKIDSRIFSMGIYDKSEKEDVLRNMSILVIPSLWPETFGFGSIEALSVGTPVVCSDIVGSKECIHENVENKNQIASSCIFKNGNVEDLAKTLAEIIKHKHTYWFEGILSMKEHCKLIEKNLYM